MTKQAKQLGLMESLAWIRNLPNIDSVELAPGFSDRCVFQVISVDNMGRRCSSLFDYKDIEAWANS